MYNKLLIAHELPYFVLNSRYILFIDIRVRLSVSILQGNENYNKKEIPTLSSESLLVRHLLHSSFTLLTGQESATAHLRLGRGKRRSAGEQGHSAGSRHSQLQFSCERASICTGTGQQQSRLAAWHRQQPISKRYFKQNFFFYTGVCFCHLNDFFK